MKQRLLSGALTLLLLIFAAVTIIPFIWMLLSSFKHNAEIVSSVPTWFPQKPTFSNYYSIQEKFNVFRFFFNSLFVTICTTGLVAYTSTLCGFVLEKYEFRGRKIFFMIILSTMMVPWCVTIIPRYSIMRALRWMDSYSAVIIPAACSGFGIFMMKQSLCSLPNEMLEAARIDGASEWFILHRIVFPMSRNTISSIVIFQFLWSWEDYLWPYLIINSSEKQLLAVGLKMFNGRYGTDYGGLFAATAISIIPVIAVYVIFQKQFIKGLSASSIKG